VLVRGGNGSHLIERAADEWRAGGRTLTTEMKTLASIEGAYPVLMSSDIDASVRFYERLGFRELFRDSPSDPKYAGVARDGAVLHLQWHDRSHWEHRIDRPTYRLVVDDVDGFYADLANRGALPARNAMAESPWAKPGDTPWGTREFHVRDPDGNGLQFCRSR
jgi:catechol 2,3-dioxygenase-like lactoylglutathione lyase family enzyme